MHYEAIQLMQNIHFRYQARYFLPVTLYKLHQGRICNIAT